MSFSVKTIDKGFLATFDGVLRVEDIHACDDVLHRQNRQQTMEFFVYDFRKADLSQMTLDDCHTVGQQDLSREGDYVPLRGALVTVDPTDIEVCQQYIRYVEFMGINWDIRVLPDLHQAFDWLLGNNQDNDVSLHGPSQSA